ncbi:MAG: Mbov_0395 family pilin-like conjugal transfer protein [bacterium]
MKITKKHLLATLLSLTLIMVLISPSLVLVGAKSECTGITDDLERLRCEAGYKEDTDLVTTIGIVINVILGLLGVVAVVIIIIGGFKWMTAGGNDEKISEAKKLIGQGVIGLIIVLAAYAIARFVMDKLKPEFLE